MKSTKNGNPMILVLCVVLLLLAVVWHYTNRLQEYRIHDLEMKLMQKGETP